MNMADKFEQWCIFEIMGHQTYAGMVSEQSIGGSSFVRIDVPECDGIPAFSKCFGAGSIYCITPVTEEIARMRAKSLRQAPLSIYDLPSEIRDKLRTPALTGPSHNEFEDFDPNDDMPL
jgi:hypothetical protein